MNHRRVLWFGHFWLTSNKKLLLLRSRLPLLGAVGSNNAGKQHEFRPPDIDGIGHAIVCQEAARDPKTPDNVFKVMLDKNSRARKSHHKCMLWENSHCLQVDKTSESAAVMISSENGDGLSLCRLHCGIGSSRLRLRGRKAVSPPLLTLGLSLSQSQQ